METVEWSHGFPHQHEFFELAYVENGAGINIVNDREQVINKGDFFILDPTTIHNFRKLGSEKLLITNCLFLPELIDNTLKNIRSLDLLLNNYLIKIDSRLLLTPPNLLIFHDKENTVFNIIQILRREFHQQRFAYQEIARTLFIQILIFAIRELGQEIPDNTKSLSARLIEEVEKNPQSNRILQSFAASINYSTPYVSRKFKEETGQTFISFLQKYRVDQSCRLLINTDSSIGDIAESVGYSDWVFFHKLFKKLMKCTPMEYRKLYQLPTECEA